VSVRAGATGKAGGVKPVKPQAASKPVVKAVSKSSGAKTVKPTVKAPTKASGAKPVKAVAKAAAPTKAPGVKQAAKPAPVKVIPNKAAAVPARQSPDFQPPKQTPPRRRRPRIVAAKTLGKPTGSVADRLRELSGRSYDIYQDRFLAKSRPAIRRVLSAGRGLFFTLPEEAEDLVYTFLREHYSDPYMDWEGSEEKASLKQLGFELESINPVIDECFRNL
jgi:hypothetical protein